MTPDRRDRQLLEIALTAGSAGRHKADLEEARLNAKELAKPTAEELEALSADRLDMVPVVVLTSSTQDRDIGECYRLGANGFVVKPIDLRELERVVHRIGLFWLTVNWLPR